MLPTLGDLRVLLAMPRPRAVAALRWWAQVDPVRYALFEMALHSEALRRAT